ncbi:MAG: hypothetical protein OEV89_11000 [Desulfobulbaceae bacterium]|nr:hypothetical protein [Desulfobulbaceae bacterium]HIJ91216.1 hypothetical protein [Deltaproteobacteria bacterium]
MKRFKYRMNDGKELWVCDNCKKSRAELILLKSWKLIDKREDGSDCEFCSQPTYAALQATDLCTPHSSGLEESI